MNKFNKRGGVLGMYLVVAVTLVLVLTTLYVFISFNSDLGVESKKASELIYFHSLEKAYIQEVFYSSLKTARLNSENSPEEIKKKLVEVVKERDLGIAAGRNFFDKVEKGEISVLEQEGRMFLVISDIEIITEREGGEIKSTLELKAEI